ncbi:MAG: N-acetylmuramoyl-L-alanine amidase-like domain-containing protein [Fimbriimonadaceae bacterium]
MGREFLEVPYVGWTLEGNPERCQVFWDKLDCVTFLETSWAVARCASDVTESKVREAVRQTRYRGERVSGYWSRLHYTTDFFETHRRDGKLKIVLEGFVGGVDWNPDTSYMSTHPEKYLASEYVENFEKSARAMEDKLASVRFKRIPVERWQENLKFMQSGDFLGFCTTKKGLDFSHVAIYSGDGKFLHASSSAGKVVEQDLVAWGKGVRTCNGMVVVRAQPFPLD